MAAFNRKREIQSGCSGDVNRQLRKIVEDVRGGKGETSERRLGKKRIGSQKNGNYLNRYV